MRKMLLAALFLMTAMVTTGIVVSRMKSHTDSVDRLIWNGKFGERYGVSNTARLRSRLQMKLEDANGRDADLFIAVEDVPEVVTIWAALARRNPNDAFAQWALASDYIAEGEYEKALAPMKAAVDLHPSEKEVEYFSSGREKLIDGDYCSLLRRLDRHDEVLAVCRAGVEKGCNQCRVSLGRALLEDGQTDEALKILDDAVVADRQDPHAYFARGLAHWVRHETDRANDDWASALKRDPSFTPAERMIEQLDHSLDDVKKWRRTWEKVEMGNAISWCAHYMTELELPEQAKRCSEVAERLDPGSTDAQRLWHRAEFDLPGARAEAEALLLKNPPIATLGAIGDIRMRTGNQEGAIELFKKVIADDLRSGWGHAELKEACEEIGDLRCVEHERRIQDGEAGH